MMKKYLSIFAAAISAAMMLFVSCTKQDETKPIAETQLSVDNDDLQIDEYGDDKIITFTWTPVEYEGTVTYMLMITKAEDTGFAACIDTTTAGTSLSLTSANVRDIANTLKIDLSVGASLIAKVMATAGAGKTSYSNVVTFKAKKDNSSYETIYPIGAMDWDWDPATAEAMHTDDGIVYTWIGNIKANNDFKFLCQNDGNWVPSYNRDAEAGEYWTAYKKTEDWQPDTCFKIEKSGRYKITLNIQDLTVKVEPNSEGFAKLYPVGAMEWGWNLEDAEEMTTNDGVVYTWTGHISANDFKFECQKTAWEPSYNRDAEAGEYWTAYYRTHDWEPDTQWKVDIPGIYTLTINIETLAVECKPEFDPSTWEHLYPIGAMDWAWDPTQAEEMSTSDGVVYTWTGNITANNGFKFLCQNDGVNWIPSYNRDAEAGEYWTAYKKSEDWQPDTCFEVSESGKYTITLNTSDLSVSVDKVIEKPGIYPVGGCFAWGWDNTQAEPMMTWNDKDYFWAGWLNVGTFKLLCYKEQWVPSYNRDPEAQYYWTMKYRNDGGADDTLFDIEEAGQYIIELNTETLEISCIKDHTYDYNPIYPIGAMYWAWDPTAAEHMFTQDGENYYWYGELKAINGFKFLCQNDGVNWIPSYNRDAEAGEYWTAYKRSEDWQPDDTFNVTEGGIYKLTLNTNTLAVSADRLGDVK